MDSVSCSPLNTSFYIGLSENPEFAEMRHSGVILTLQRRHGSTCGQRAAVRFLSFPMADPICLLLFRISKGAKIRNRYNQVPHLTQDTNEKVTNSQLDTTNQSQEVSPFPAGDHKAHINRCAQRHSKHKTEQKHKRSTKEVPPWNGQ